MSEEFELLDVTVHRVQVDNVVIKVPKGWKPVLWELRQIMPQVEKLRLESQKTWRPENNSLLPAVWRVLEVAGNPHHIDARVLVENLPPAYDPEELQKLQEQGAKAWAGVPDAAEWLRELRGARSKEGEE